MQPAAQTESLARAALKIYGRRSALTIEATETRGEGYPTLTIEGADKRSDSKSFAWQAKIAVQLTRQELPLFIATLLGLRPRFEAGYHGPERNKGVVLERQESNLYVKLSEAGRVVGVPVGYCDGVHLGAFALERLHASHPRLDSQSLLAILKMTPGLSASAT
jgi:hypothetical protein